MVAPVAESTKYAAKNMHIPWWPPRIGPASCRSRNRHIHDLLSVRAAELSRLATTVRSNLDQAEALIPVVNGQLAELATMGVEGL